MQRASTLGTNQAAAASISEALRRTYRSAAAVGISVFIPGTCYIISADVPGVH